MKFSKLKENIPTITLVPVDPVSAAFRWCWAALLLAVMFAGSAFSGDIGSVFMLLFCLAFLSLYVPDLFKVGRFEKPFSGFYLHQIKMSPEIITAIESIEKKNNIAKLILSWCLRLLGLYLLLAALSSLMVSPLLFFLFGPVSGFLLFLSYRIGARTASELLKKKDIPPVLYLRSFTVDDYDEGDSVSQKRKDQGATKKGVAWWRPKSLQKSREEHVLARIFTILGPFIAIGKPGEQLPHLGAARMYVSDSSWQSEVQQLIQRANLVVLRVGNSEGFIWEVKKVLELRAPEQVLFYFSQSLTVVELDKLYQQFVAATHGLFPKPLPVSLGNYRFLSFNTDWTPIAFGEIESIKPMRFIPIPLSIRTWLFENKLYFLIGQALRGFFEKRGLRSSHHRLFGDFSIGLGAFLGTPVMAGLMIMRNLWCTGKRKLAVITLFAIIIPSAIAVIFILALTSGKMGTALSGIFIMEQYRLLSLVVETLFAFTIYFTWRRWSGDVIRQHLSTGGPRFSALQVFLFIVIPTVLWSGFKLLPFYVLVA